MRIGSGEEIIAVNLAGFAADFKMHLIDQIVDLTIVFCIGVSLLAVLGLG